MRQEVYTKFAAAIDGRVQQKRAESRRDAVYCKLAEELARGRIEKRAQLAGNARMVGRGLRHVIRAIVGARGAAGEIGNAGRLASLNPGLAESLSRTGLSLRRMLSPEIKLRGRWDPRRLLTYVTRTARNADNSGVVSGLSRAGAYHDSGIPTFGSLPHPGGIMEKHRLSPLKALAATGIAGGGAAAAMSDGSQAQDAGSASGSYDRITEAFRRIMANSRVRNALIGAGVGGVGTALLSDGDIAERLLKGLAGAAVAGGATYAAPSVLDHVPGITGT